MFSTVLTTVLADASLGLTKGQNLFSEQSSVAQCVLVKTTRIEDIAPGIPDVRRAVVQLLVKGYSVEEGYALADSAVKALEAMPTESSDGDVQYTIKSVVVRNRPVFVAYGNEKAHSANLELFYSIA